MALKLIRKEYYNLGINTLYQDEKNGDYILVSSMKTLYGRMTYNIYISDELMSFNKFMGEYTLSAKSAFIRERE